MRSSWLLDDGPGDSVDRLLESWSQAAPDLDLSPVAIVARLARVRRIIEVELKATFAEHGLTAPDFAALVTLRRLERPGGVPQSLLMRELGLTSGTISVRVERLCTRGLARRSVDPDDQRNSLISLTEAGRRLFDQVAPAHAATERRLLAALDPEQREQLVCLLRELLVSLEEPTADGSRPTLGLRVAPAHDTLRIRRAAGLPETVGLMVRDVAPEGPAAGGGLRIGDVLTRLDGRELRSVTALYAAARQARRGGKLRVNGVRGMHTRFEAVLRLSAATGDSRWPAGADVTGELVHTV